MGPGARCPGIARYSKEEATEYLEALEGEDTHHMAEECGDTLFTLLASIAAAEAAGIFSYQDVLERAHEKMIRRHDHVFGENKATTPEDRYKLEFLEIILYYASTRIYRVLLV